MVSTHILSFAAGIAMPNLLLDSAHALAFNIAQLDRIKFPNLNNRQNAKSTFTYTHLEGNGQLWQIKPPSKEKKDNVISLVVDPLASQLDFGIPWGYRANKKILSERETIDKISEALPSHCLLTMGLDDHTHLPTITKLLERLPNLKFVVAPSCVKKLIDGAGVDNDRITVLKHWESFDVDCYSSGMKVKVTATEGALVGPPWQTRENGYLVQMYDETNENNGESSKANISIYYEPHADVVLENLIKAKDELGTPLVRADVMVSPITKQCLPANVPPQGQYTLVHGAERTLQIADAILAKIVIPLGNGALDIDGPLAGLVEATGDLNDLEELVSHRNRERGAREIALIRVEKPTPGVPLAVTL